MKTTLQILVLIFLWKAAALPAAEDGGRIASPPWSGHWWPHNEGGIVAPLSKYDKFAKKRAARWERTNHVRTTPRPLDWFGHCHAWAAAAVSELEPKVARTVGEQEFAVGDLKGLLTACHAQDVANTYGTRFNANGEEAAYEDLAPDQLWRLLQTYLKQRQIPLIVDLEAGEEVWNYPVCEYLVEYEPTANGWYSATLTLIVVSNNVELNFVGFQPAIHRYSFRVKVEDGAIVMGSGQWTGDSVKDHPDFAWYPFVAVAENPEIDVDKVTQIMGRSVGAGNAPPRDVDLSVPPDTELVVDTESATAGQPTTELPTTELPTTELPTTGTPVTGPAVVDPVTAEGRTNSGNVEAAEPHPEDDADVAVGNDESAESEAYLLSPDDLLAMVLEKTSDMFVDVQVDRGDGGTYFLGDPVSVTLVVRDPKNLGVRSGYVYLFDIRPDGELRLVYPRRGSDNEIEVGKIYRLPTTLTRELFHADQSGQHDLKAIVLDEPIHITGFENHPSALAQSIAPAFQQPTQAAVAGQALVVHPQCRERIRQRLRQRTDNSPNADWRHNHDLLFGQDVCAYRVIPNPDTKGK